MRTGLSDRLLLGAGGCGIAMGLAVGVAGVFVISPWVLGWAVAGAVLMMGYVLEWNRAMHSDVAFGLAWGGFPVLVGYWAQTERVGMAVLLVAAAATL